MSGTMSMSDPVAARFKSRTGRYAISLIALLLAAALTLLIVHFKLPRQINGYAFLLVIIGSAWWGGYGPGLVTTFATLLLGPYLTQPTYSIRHPTLGSAPMVVLISVLISRMAGARQKLREANVQLDERVRHRTAELEMVNRSLREREAQLIAQAENLSESNADLEQFAYFASHDLQEPLRMISVYTELLEHNHESNFDEESAMCARMVRDSVCRLEVLVRESEAAEIISGDLPTLHAYPVHLIQIFQNLIGNARKYRGTEPPRIIIAATRSPNEWIFSVKDNGMGISTDYRDKIFIPFKRLHGQQYPGSGVGLAICRRIVERLGGRIWVDSQLGHGATFYFSVPIAPSHSDMAQRVSVSV
jgi:light-regulated signal transduction histidine kinase (bacteriophytochrome)